MGSEFACPRCDSPSVAYPDEGEEGLYAPAAVLFSPPAASSGGLLSGGKSIPRFEPAGAKPQPSSERRFISP